MYARDLAFAPVRALQRVLVLIRDGQFDPDQSRADFFQRTNPLVPGTPAPVFQPGTPACLTQEAPAVVQEPEPNDGDWEHVEPKKEDSIRETPSVQVMSDIEVVSSSESESSTSGCEDVDSDLEQTNEVDDAERPANEDVFSLDGMVKNNKSGIIHAVPDIAPVVTESSYTNGEILQKRTTRCGRITSSGFTVVHSVPDWTAKCRICFKRHREPQKLW